MEFVEWKIKHAPEKPLDYVYLWNRGDTFCFYLTVEDFEFRIYSYEYRDEESLMEDWNLDADWVYPIDNFFNNGGGYLDIDSLWYVKAEFSSEDAVEMARELLEACCDQLDYKSYRIFDYDSIPSELLVDFIRRWIAKTKYGKVYAYYK